MTFQSVLNGVPGAALQVMSRECAVKKEALSCCQATMSAIKTVDEKLTSHIRYLYFVSGGSNQQQGMETPCKD